MNRDDLIMVCYSDIAGQVRGKGFPARDLEARLKGGIGWTPTNIMITAFGPIADSPWGALDDLIMMPDPAAKAMVEFGDGSPPEHFYLGDVLHLDGTPWDCCPRGLLKRAVAELEAEGLRLNVAFEHELYYEGALERIGAGYSLDSVRRQFEVNALGPLRVTCSLIPALRNGAKIALLTSRMGSIADNESGGSYGYRMSKAALNAAGVSLAKDLSSRGIAVAILHPGYVKTDMTGPSALIDAEESVAGLLDRIDQLNLENSGSFWHMNGELLPW